MNGALALQQQALLQALWQRQHQDAMNLVAPHANTAGTAAQNLMERGLKAYRSNSRELAPRALAAAYPVLARLLDEDNFAALSREFWLAQPPLRGDIAQWGAALPAFVEALPQLQEEPYLADVARVEWALHAAATAADARPDPASVTLILSPGCTCVASTYPVVSIVNAHLRGEPSLAEAGRRLREGERETALVWRQGLKPQVRDALAGEAKLVAALEAGAPLSDALNSAPDLDFNPWLALAVQTGLLAGARRTS